MEFLSRSLAEITRLRNTPLKVAEPLAVFRIVGPGAEQCLQGMVTSDISKPGPDSVSYGAVLTPKGMIVVDAWIGRLDDGFLFLTGRSARQASLDLFRRQLPPRLAKVTDVTDAWETRWLLGQGADSWIDAIGCARPEPGQITRCTLDAGEVIAAAPGSKRAGFRYLIAGPRDAILDADQRMGGDAIAGDIADLRAARVLAGFPTLGAEIDERTLPQEVDFDGIGGISYTKGCYVGQETVARLHFRGHANWLLRGFEVTGDTTQLTDPFEWSGKPVMRIGTVIVINPEQAIGLARVRREVEPGTVLDSNGLSLRIIALDPPPNFFAAPTSA